MKRMLMVALIFAGGCVTPSQMEACKTACWSKGVLEVTSYGCKCAP